MVPTDFASHWIAAWNAHDLDQVLALYTEDFSMRSPHIIKIAGEPSGKLQGKPAIRAYWSKALELYPDLHFTLVQEYAGIDTAVLTYTNHLGGKVGEFFYFNDEGKIIRSSGNYA